MKTTGKNKKDAFEGKRSYQETMEDLNSRLKKYDKPHEKFVVPWQMVEGVEKESNS